MEDMEFEGMMFRYRMATSILRHTDEDGRWDLLASVLMPTDRLRKLSIEAAETERQKASQRRRERIKA